MNIMVEPFSFLVGLTLGISTFSLILLVVLMTSTWPQTVAKIHRGVEWLERVTRPTL